ncbi:unnamed protein product [Vitrella brassicaformis CCMP3155]|uniref:Uncharacterized protein n=4 Tax=Vitrella brassicaformis TaxID=1169539 RepID=A0A0G4FGA8_VITBC|nr:unnamed protein product [Vitrella brassicaformis CCMP3155]|eukprot:CEM12296.1 unnamed protein product [Vitrella brassicaformis CCMP3155]
MSAPRSRRSVASAKARPIVFPDQPLAEDDDAMAHMASILPQLQQSQPKARTKGAAKAKSAKAKAKRGPRASRKRQMAEMEGEDMMDVSLGEGAEASSGAAAAAASAAAGEGAGGVEDEEEDDEEGVDDEDLDFFLEGEGGDVESEEEDDSIADEDYDPFEDKPSDESLRSSESELGALEESSASSSEVDEFLTGGPGEPGAPKKRKGKPKAKAAAAAAAAAGAAGEGGEDKAKAKRRKKKKYFASQPTKMSPEIAKMYGEANEYFLNKQHQQAITVLNEIVRRAPGLSDPFHTLGLIYEELGDKKKAVHFYLIAASLVQRDEDQWLNVARLAQEIGDLQQAIHCYGRCLVNVPKDDTQKRQTVTWEMALCHLAKGGREDSVKAANHLQALFDVHKGDPDVGRELAKVYHKLDRRIEAIKVLEDVLDSSAEVDPNTLNMLCELYITQKEYSKAFDTLTSLFQDRPLNTFPADLVTKLGVAACHLQKYALADDVLEVLQHYPASTHADLYLSMADALADGGPQQHQQALMLVQKLPVDSLQLSLTRNEIEVWSKLAYCHIKLGQYAQAAELLETALKLLGAPSYENMPPEIAAPLADVYQRLGRRADADAISFSLNFRQIMEAKQIPKALTTQQRQDLLHRLQSELETLLSQTSPAPLPTTHPLLPPITECIQHFLHLVRDSELDVARASRLIARQDESAAVGLDEDDSDLLGEEGEDGLFVMKSKKRKRRGSGAGRGKRRAAGGQWTGTDKLFSHVMISKSKEELGLKSVEDLVGYEGYGSLICKGVDLMRRAGRVAEGVRLMEEIVASHRKLRLHSGDAIDKPKKAFLIQLRKFSLECCMSGGRELQTVALKRVKWVLVRTSVRGNKVVAPPTKVLEAFCWLLFMHPYTPAVTTAVHRIPHVRDLRTWIVRRLHQHPNSYGFMMIAAHFCLMASNYPLAVKAYTKAHLLKTEDPLNSLCLAVCYTLLATSRTTTDKLEVVQKAEVMLYKYVELRHLFGELHRCMKLLEDKERRERLEKEKQGQGQGQGQPASEPSSSAAAAAAAAAAPPGPPPPTPTSDPCRDVTMDGAKEGGLHASHVLPTVYEAEIRYNKGRWFQALSVFNEAMLMYRQVLQLLTPLQEAAQEARSKAPPGQMPDPPYAEDIIQILRCTAYNRTIIFINQRTSQMQARAQKKYIVWK